MGGRKQFNVYLFCLLITLMALRLDASFEAYAGFIAAGLLTTSAIHAAEDQAKNKRPAGRRRATDPGSEEVRP